MGIWKNYNRDKGLGRVFGMKENIRSLFPCAACEGTGCERERLCICFVTYYMGNGQWISHKLFMNVSIYKKDVEFVKIIFKQIAHSTFNSARGVWSSG